MAKLLYINNLTADGHINDAEGRFDWTEPSEEFFELHTELQRSIGTHLYGRRLYGFMSAWETMSPESPPPGGIRPAVAGS